MSMISKEKYEMTREIQAILDIGYIELTITGQLTDGTRFEAKDTVKVIDKGTGKTPR